MRVATPEQLMAEEEEARTEEEARRAQTDYSLTIHSSRKKRNKAEEKAKVPVREAERAKAAAKAAAKVGDYIRFEYLDYLVDYYGFLTIMRKYFKYFHTVTYLIRGKENKDYEIYKSFVNVLLNWHTSPFFNLELMKILTEYFKKEFTADECRIIYKYFKKFVELSDIITQKV